ncbi:transketolase [Fibrobacterota bacterium]
MELTSIDQKCINTIRLLSADAVEKAKSGHPGLPLGAASIAYTLWTRTLKHNPNNPQWFNRDRFVLSAGHGSALLYSMLHITGYDLPLEEVMNFRQWGSKTPGHPEYGQTVGVETTTGPLGQGFANAVGFAIAERFLAEHFNRPNFEMVDHYTYVLCGDGDLMEGVSSEAASIAGHLKLGKLICFYDDNHITIEGATELTFTESVQKRFEAYGWQVIDVNGDDIGEIESAALLAQKETLRPTLICARTHIGFGSGKQDSADAHGAPLGESEVAALKEKFGFPSDTFFNIPDDVREHIAGLMKKGPEQEEQWNTIFEEYTQQYPDLAQQWLDALQGKQPEGWEGSVPVFSKEDKLATRQASGKVMNAVAEKLPFLIGGSADLAPSTGTYLKKFEDFAPKGYNNPNLRFGVREHAMGSIVNGLALSRMLIPYGSTFLVFADYMKPALRLAALMDVPSVFVFTHDSIGVGEDGPTHQPIEQAAMLRSIPNMTVIRPADANETAAAWKISIERKKPVALLLSRQKLPIFDIGEYPVQDGVPKGAYILDDAEGTPEIIIIATGSEVHLALAAKQALKNEGNKVRIVSMPSWELFREQSQEYRDQVLPPTIKKRIAVEAASSMGWHEWVGDQGIIIGIDKFGASAPGGKVMEEYGFTVENVVAKIRHIIQ